MNNLYLKKFDCYQGSFPTVILLIITIVLSSPLPGQQNALDVNYFQKLELSSLLFDHSVYGSSRFLIKDFERETISPIHDRFTNIHEEGYVMHAISGLRYDLTSKENELLTVISRYYPDPITTPAILELGSYYYNQNWYRKATDMYDMVDITSLNNFEMSEAAFKKGYCHFVLKEFDEAKKNFTIANQIDNIYYYPSNYYLGLTNYFLGEYKDAITHFEKVNQSTIYKSFTPYYIIQIYFAQRNTDNVIEYGENSLKNPELRNRTEIRLLLGQAYFEQKLYSKALPHLEYYESLTEKLTIEEFYQLGFTQYQLGKYTDAISTFKELSLQETQLGQLVNYIIADCYIKLDDKNSARTAFKKVSTMDFNPIVKQEGLFNYGKLSAESGFEREAINALLRTDGKSAYFKESQSIINDVLQNSGDYAFVIQTIENIPNKTEGLKKTHQRACLLLGMQQYVNDQKQEAIKSFTNGEKFPLDKNIHAQSTFWKGLIYRELDDIDLSISTFNTYFDLSNGVNGIPEESSPYMAHYTQGYNYLTKKDFKKAEKSFKNSVVGLNIAKSGINNKLIVEDIYPDALVKAADCMFKNTDYVNALVIYEQAISTKKGAFIYAMYQKATIEGLIGEPYDKIITLTELKSKFPNSEYADNALLQIGNTYFDLGNIDNAYKAMTELIEKYPKSDLINGALLKMGLIAYNNGDLQKAIKHYKSVFQHNPTSKESESALISLQEIYINDLGNAEDYVEFANSVQKNKITTSTADSLAYSVGFTKYEDGEYDKAIQSFNNYLDKYPKGASRLSAFYYRAESHTLSKKYPEALKDYESVLSYGESQFYQTSAKKAAIIAYNSTQNFEIAYKYYDLHYNLTSNGTEKYADALGAMRSAFRISKGTEVIKYGQIVIENKNASKEEFGTAHYYLAKSYIKTNELEKSKSHFSKVPDFLDNNQAAESRYMIAEILFNQNKITEAEKQCNTANELNTYYPYWIAKSLLLLSDIYIVNKDLYNARAAIEAVVENFSEDENLITIAKSKLEALKKLEDQNNRVKNPNGKQLNMMPSNKKP